MASFTMNPNSDNIDWDAFHDAVDAIPMQRVLELLGTDTGPLLKGGNRHVKCPAHNDNGPSLFVYQTGSKSGGNNYAFCYGACQRGYGPASLFAKTNGIDMLAAYDQLGELFNIKPGESAMGIPRARVQHIAQPPTVLHPPVPMATAMVDLYHQQLSADDYRMLEKDWLLPREFVDLMCIGHTLRKDKPAAWSIPVWGSEPGWDLWTVRYRRDDKLTPNHDSKYWGEVGRNDLYPFCSWLAEIDNPYCWLVESEKTGLVGAVNGYPFLTLTGGVSAHPDAWLHSYRKLLDRYDFLIAAHDDDEAGAIAAEKIWRAFPGRVIRFPWPTTAWGGKDPLDFFHVFGIDAFLERSEMVVAQHKGALAAKRLPPIDKRGQYFGWQDVQPVEWVA